MEKPTLKIASIGPDIPHPLLAATGSYAGLLQWNIDRSFPHASQWLESKFPLWAFSIVEDWAAGVFDHLEAVVFSRGDDAAQRIYYYICELRERGLIRGPEPLIMDVARISRSGSEQRCIAAVRKLAVRFGAGDEAVEAAIAEANARLPASQAADTSRNVLLAGTLPPDLRLHRMVQAAGWNPVGETMDQSWGRTHGFIDQGSGDPCAALGRHLHTHASGARSFHDRAARVTETAAACGAAAAVLWYSEEDEAEIWSLPAQRKALADAGVAALVLPRRSWRADDGVDGEIAAFLQEIEQ